MTPMEYADEYFRLNFERQAKLASEGHNFGSLEEEIAIAKEMVAKIVQAAIEEERKRCLDMLNRCRAVYDEYHDRARARDRGEDPAFYPTVKATDTAHKLNALEYAIFVVGDWSLSEHFREDQMPMPF